MVPWYFVHACSMKSGISSDPGFRTKCAWWLWYVLWLTTLSYLWKEAGIVTFEESKNEFCNKDVHRLLNDLAMCMHVHWKVACLVMLDFVLRAHGDCGMFCCSLLYLMFGKRGVTLSCSFWETKNELYNKEFHRMLNDLEI